MLNPFTPSNIVSNPNEFFGREDELITIEKTFSQSSVAIQGIVGIGKSSLAYQARLRLEGAGRAIKSTFVTTTCYAELVDVDDLASSIVRELVEVDEVNHKVTGKASIFTAIDFGGEAGTISRNYVEGKHFEILQRILAKKNVTKLAEGHEFLIIWLDEVDKAVEPVARFVRALLNKTQADGINHIRFLLTGVQPFFNRLLAVDEGLIRAFPQAINLPPLSYDESVDLLQAKLTRVIKSVQKDGHELGIHPAVIARIAELSNGNPSLLQLIGYSVVESENENRDGMIDEKDLLNSLNEICLNKRAIHYDALIEDLYTKESLKSFVSLYREMTISMPGFVSTGIANQIVSQEELDLFLAMNLIRKQSSGYVFVDELFRVRIALDMNMSFGSKEEFVKEMARFTDPDFEELYKDESDDLEEYY